ncbi:uncharacterized protein LOC129957606 [Argiope bruennichi]|uniref:uncharacterized protein LOC129957606 n=1 Tax=Argiope bruennichi TaxID=94029 RepID=UPI002494A7F0|nr:uncharacterized protein LOC129957606 [Argiope bruennichi]
MAEDTLYRLCMQTVYDLIAAKVWDSSAQNPFSKFQSKVVEDLVDFVRSQRGYSDDKNTMENLMLLFASGRIRKFDAFHWNSKKNQTWLPGILTENFCKNLLSLSLPKHFYAIYPVKSILPFCRNLVDVHLPVFIDLEVFENCPQLQILRFHASDDEISHYFRQKTGDLPSTIRKLQVFSVCNCQIHYAVTKDIIAKLLLNCPNLVSVGFCNSLDAFHYIRETQDELSNPFQLRRCYWGLKYTDFIPTPDNPEFERYQSQFSHMVKVATSLCSSLEELVIDVFDNNCVQHLVKLKNLKVLSISYEDPYDDNYVPAFVSLLREIGKQLSRLSVTAQGPVPMDVICRYCPYLVTLRILGKVTISNRSKKCKRLPLLKSLCVDVIDKEDLKLFFLNCPNMKELFVGTAVGFVDSFCETLLKKEVYPKLEVVSIETCSLTKRGLLKFLNGIPTLQKVSFEILGGTREKPKDIIKQWIKKSKTDVEVDERLYRTEFFRRETHPCVF